MRFKSRGTPCTLDLFRTFSLISSSLRSFTGYGHNTRSYRTTYRTWTMFLEAEALFHSAPCGDAQLAAHGCHDQ